MAIGTLVVPTEKALTTSFTPGKSQPPPTPTNIARKIHRVR